MTVPKLTPEEKQRALEKAQEMRKQRAAIRKALKKGDLTLAQLLDRAEDEIVARMRVTYLLQSMPQIGKIKCKKIMNEIGIDEGRRVQGLGNRQIDALLERLG